MNISLPNTIERVRIHTKEKVNQKIDEKMVESITKYYKGSREDVLKRLQELDAEWDIERTLETHAATAALASSVIGFFTKERKWYAVTGVIGGFLLQHALQGWCPPVSILRRFGVRTLSEIEQEKSALRVLLERKS
ncbi:YgaP family membrane protein [Clostridium omnivorum]|uniref:Inner membrane protein YgaP-like transmembrane domain-containing protein n=1 Tax=Clostridium omnivorum TaxID=1604902 RepID=A0ABQ5N0S5_9CLOT|nr:DUF2892 domain-containing protein [Clostridium sp. E14]GLC28804.1 hypothetical protein bsdE14_02140 [Clostridium sp. E14]